MFDFYLEEYRSLFKNFKSKYMIWYNLFFRKFILVVVWRMRVGGIGDKEDILEVVEVLLVRKGIVR